MKLRDIIKNIDKSSKTSDWVEVETLVSELGLPYGDYQEQTRITSYYFGSWICTDTEVGYKVYFLDDKAIAVSTQTGRKYSEEIEWVSEELAIKTRDYLISLLIPKEDKLNISLVDLDEDWGESFSNDYYPQIHYRDNMTYNGEKVKVIGVETEKFNLGTKVIIENENGEQKTIKTHELKLGFYLKK